MSFASEGHIARVAVSVKTTVGGLWIIPQVEELRRRGVEVVVVLPDGPGRLVQAVEQLARSDDGITLVRSPFDFSFRPSVRLVRGLFQLRAMMKDLRVDAVLYHLYATALAMRFATLGRRVRRVHMVAGPLYLESRIIRMFERVLCRLDTIVVCGSEYTADCYRSLGLPDHRLVVIPYGVDTTRFAPDALLKRQDSRRQFQLGADDFVVVMVAFVYAPKKLVFDGKGIKGHEDLLAAWPDFRDAHPESRLLLVGAGFDAAGEAYRASLISSFPGELDDAGIRWIESVDDVRSAYAAADVSISPSLSENHGAALEASSMGKPCIVSDAGALPETVTDETGWVHTAGSPGAIRVALENALTAAQADEISGMGRRARARTIALFDQADCATRVADVVLERRPVASTSRS